MDIAIEKATTKDAAEILALQKLSFKKTADLYVHCTINPMAETLERLKKEILDKMTFKAVHEGRVIGSIRGYKENETCYMEKLMVHPSYQNNGIGTRLFKSLEEHYAGRVSRYQLSTVLESEKHVRLYKKFGYRPYKKQKVGDSVTYVYMEKNV